MATTSSDSCCVAPPYATLNESECPVCIETLGQSGDVTLLGCGHAFHDTCLQSWTRSNLDQGFDARCPVCRYTYEQSDVENAASTSNEDIETDDAEWMHVYVANLHGLILVECALLIMVFFAPYYTDMYWEQYLQPMERILCILVLSTAAVNRSRPLLFVSWGMLVASIMKTAWLLTDVTSSSIVMASQSRLVPAFIFLLDAYIGLKMCQLNRWLLM